MYQLKNTKNQYNEANFGPFVMFCILLLVPAVPHIVNGSESQVLPQDSCIVISLYQYMSTKVPTDSLNDPIIFSQNFVLSSELNCCEGHRRFRQSLCFTM